MKKLIRIVTFLLVFLHVLSLAVPLPAVAASSNYGVIIINSEGKLQLYNNLIVISPAGNLMIKANRVCKYLGLIYKYDKKSKKLTVKNPKNGKSLAFTMENEKFAYYPSDNSSGIIKNAVYKSYYDKKHKCNLIHMQTLQYILGYNYYKDLEGSYYDNMGYKAIVVYNIDDYDINELPITSQLIDFVNAKTFTSKDELLDAVRINMLARNTNVTFKTNRKVMEQIGSRSSIYSLVIGIDNKTTSKDADYLSLLIDKFGQKWRSSSKVLISSDGSKKEIKSNDDPVSLTIDVKYETTLEQEAVVDAILAEIVQKLKLKEVSSDYEKVKLIHDYIINNSSYDINLKKSSAYDLLVEKSAVCEGYAITAYRLFLAAGLESRIISGYGDGEPHAWNIVKVDGKWYNIDLTWDDPVSRSGRQVLKYDYFLKSDNDFPKHERKAEYNTKDFLKAYPISQTSYQPVK